MAIPKLLNKMRHSVQDTGDDNMTGNYVLEGGVLQSSNSDVEMLSNSIAIADSLIEVPDESNLLRLYYDVNGTSYTQGITHQYIPQKGLQINMDYEASGNPAIIARVADPIEAQDVATKNYVDTELTSKIDDNGGFGTNTELTDAIITLAGDPTEDLEAATKQYVDNSGGTFYATYQTTTYTEIVEAYNKGKSIILYYSNKFYPLINMDDTTIVFGQRSQWDYGLSPQTLYKVASDDTWSTTTWSDIYGNWSMTGTLQKSSGSVNLTSTTRYYRPILVSTSAPTSSDGQIGDIWIVYKT